MGAPRLTLLAYSRLIALLTAVSRLIRKTTERSGVSRACGVHLTGQLCLQRDDLGKTDLAIGNKLDSTIVSRISHVDPSPEEFCCDECFAGISNQS